MSKNNPDNGPRIHHDVIGSLLRGKLCDICHEEITGAGSWDVNTGYLTHPKCRSKTQTEQRDRIRTLEAENERLKAERASNSCNLEGMKVLHISEQFYGEIQELVKELKSENAALKAERESNSCSLEGTKVLHMSEEFYAELLTKLEKAEKQNAAYLVELADYGKTVERLRSELDEVKKSLPPSPYRHITYSQVENT